MTRTFRRGVGVGAGLVVLLAVAIAIAFVPGLGAQEDGDEETPEEGTSEEAPEEGTDEEAPDHPGLSDEDRACLEEQGVTVPEIERDEDGRPTERPDFSDEEKEAFRAAAEACGIERSFGHHGPGRLFGSLSDEDRACLEENGADLPEIETDEDGNPVPPEERPELSDEEKEARRDAFQAAAEACGIDLPEGCGGPGGPGGFRGPGGFGDPSGDSENGGNEPAFFLA